MTFLSGHIFRSLTTDTSVSRPQGDASASLWPDIATFVVFGLVSPLVRGARSPEVREIMAGMDDRSLALLNVDRADLT